MKLRTRLVSTVAAIGLSAVALPAAAVDFLFNLTDVATFGAPTYGTVSLLQDGTSVDFKITLDPEFNFVSTGGHHVFSFNGTGVAASDITGITDSTGQSFTVDSPNAVNPPFGTFQFGIACSANCKNGGPGYGGPLEFTVANAVINDFLVMSTLPPGTYPAYFASDVFWKLDPENTSLNRTGAIAVTAAVPEPETYALFLAGLGAMGFVAKRRRKTA